MGEYQPDALGVFQIVLRRQDRDHVVGRALSRNKLPELLQIVRLNCRDTELQDPRGPFLGNPEARRLGGAEDHEGQEI